MVTFIVAGGLRHGRRTARMIVTGVMAIQIVGAIVAVATGQAQIAQLVGEIVLAVIVIALLWTGAAKEFFGQPR